MVHCRVPRVPEKYDREMYEGRWKYLGASPAFIDIFQVPDTYDIDLLLKTFETFTTTSKGEKLVPRVIRLKDLTKDIVL